MQRLERMVGADAMAGGLGGKFRTFGGLFGRVAAGLIGLGNEGVVIVAWNDEEFGHVLGFVEARKDGDHSHRMSSRMERRGIIDFRRRIAGLRKK